MPIIRFPGLAKIANGTNKEAISKSTGYTLERDGDDWVVPPNDPKLLSGPEPVLKTLKPIPLEPKRFVSIADTYIKDFIVQELDKDISLEKKGKIDIPANYGIISDISANKLEFFLSKHNNGELRECLINNLLPFMYKELGARFVSPLSVDAKKQQGTISLSKIALLVDEFGIDNISEKIFNDHSLESILPTPLTILSYPETLLTFSPLSITLPFTRIGSQLHFFNNKNWIFHRIVTCGIYELFMSNVDPISKTDDIVLFDSHKMSSIIGRRYFEALIDGINRLMMYANNPLNFTNKIGVIDNKKLVQFHSSIHLIFADISSINFTASRHIKSRMALASIDKISNLIKYAIETKFNEVDIYKILLSRDFCNKLASIVSYNLGQYDDNLAKLIKNSIITTYSSMFKKLSESTKATDELELLDHLRNMRNTVHGGFLERGKFDKTFISTSAFIPYELTYIPALLLLGLCLDTNRFLRAFTSK